MGQISYLYKFGRKMYDCKCLNGSCERFNPQLCLKDFDDRPDKPENVFVMSEYRRSIKTQQVKEY